jgi:hypothetical protein
MARRFSPVWSFTDAAFPTGDDAAGRVPATVPGAERFRGA